MKCKNFEILMMRHFEKTIAPSDACELAKHVLICENCRELYLTFDEAMSTDLSEAPKNFTSSVMEKVRAEKPYVAAKKSENNFAPRILAAVNMFLFAIGFMFALNPDLIYSLPQPVVENLFIFFGYAGSALNAAAEWVAQFSAESIGITALLLVAVTGTLLYVLHNGEKAAA